MKKSFYYKLSLLSVLSGMAFAGGSASIFAQQAPSIYRGVLPSDTLAELELDELEEPVAAPTAVIEDGYHVATPVAIYGLNVELEEGEGEASNSVQGTVQQVVDKAGEALERIKSIAEEAQIETDAETDDAVAKGVATESAPSLSEAPSPEVSNPAPPILDVPNFEAPSPEVADVVADANSVVADVNAALEPNFDPALFRAELDSLRAETLDLRQRLAKQEQKSSAITPKKSSDRFSVKFGGQLKMDGAIVTQNDPARENFGEARNSIGVRDARVVAKGEGYGGFLQYNLGFSFHDHITLRHAYVRAKDTKLGDITFGHFFVESGMESVQTNYERVFSTPDETESIFGLGRRLGMSLVRYGADKRSRAFFGIFASASIASAPERLNGEHCGIVLNTRYTTTPIFEEDCNGFTREVLHLGGSFFWLDPASTAPLVTRTRGMGWTGTNPYYISGILPLDGRNYSVTALEAAYQKDGFSVMGEGYLRSVESGRNSYGTTLSARFMLTPNATRTYNRTDARFAGVKMADDQLFLDPAHRVVGGNWGAWEAVAKWEWVDVRDMSDAASDVSYAAPPIYGRVQRAVAGMNWFWNEQVNWAFNWEHSFVDANQDGKNVAGDFDTLVIQTSLSF
ncbi:MAG: hypothetical protein IJU03_01630 [Thermoguttaceae bacterium]|nr:hypothetical protein [Thermoguttaceae bacterium]